MVHLSSVSPLSPGGRPLWAVEAFPVLIILGIGNIRLIVVRVVLDVYTGPEKVRCCFAKNKSLEQSTPT